MLWVFQCHVQVLFFRDPVVNWRSQPSGGTCPSGNVHSIATASEIFESFGVIGLGVVGLVDLTAMQADA